MDKKIIAERLEETHQRLLDWLAESEDALWEQGPEDRWTTGQHILHLVESSQLLNKALGYPKFLIRYKFGTSNRPSRSYEEVAKRYEERLAENKERAKTFNKDLRKPSVKEKKRLMDSLQILNKKLQYKTQKLKDKHLDTLLLPHPLMGRMTLREIIMWTAHHTEHHHEILKKDYAA
jgi:hypothetical protein